MLLGTQYHTLHPIRKYLAFEMARRCGELIVSRPRREGTLHPGRRWLDIAGSLSSRDPGGKGHSIPDGDGSTSRGAYRRSTPEGRDTLSRMEMLEPVSKGHNAAVLSFSLKLNKA